jgi:hypothetical protein
VGDHVQGSAVQSFVAASRLPYESTNGRSLRSLETIVGLYKTEVIHRRAPWRHLEAVEIRNAGMVDWLNHRRLLEPLGSVPPARLEATA